MALKPPIPQSARPGAKDKPKRKRELVKGKSKKHGGAEWLYERRNGKMIPVRPASKAKGDQGGKKKTGGDRAPSSSAPKPDTRPFGAYTDEINTGADNEFAGPERQLQQQEGQATQHSRDLQTVYDKFKGELMGQAAAQRAAQQASIAQTQAGIANSVGALGQAVGQGAANAGATAAATGGPDYSADVAKIGGAGAAGANAVAQPGVTALQGEANADAGFMAQLASIMDMERGQQTAKAQQSVNEIRGKRTDLAKEKATSKTKRYDELSQRDAAAKQQEIENTLAEAAITADSEEARLKYRADLVKLKHDTRTQRERNATAVDIAESGNTVRDRDSRRDADTARGRTQADRDIAAGHDRTSAANSRRSAQAKKDAAAISAAGKGSVKVKRPDGSTVTLTAADRKKWHDRRRATIAGHTALRSALASEGDEAKAVKKVASENRLPTNVVKALLNAAKKKPATASDRAALATYFPGGVVPPGYLSGKVN